DLMFRQTRDKGRRRAAGGGCAPGQWWLGVAVRDAGAQRYAAFRGDFRTTGCRVARFTTAPGGRPGDFPRGRGERVGVPTWARMRPIARRACAGVTGRRLASHGRCRTAASGRASTT